jgi:hypothetical protein
VQAYLAGTRHSTLLDVVDGRPLLRTTDGTTPGSTPGDLGFWVRQAAGGDRQRITWPVGNGDWTAVVMNRDASPGVAVTANAGAEVPALPWVVAVLFSVTGVALLLSIALIWLPLRSVRRGDARTPAT